MQRGMQNRWPETLLIVYWVVLMVATHWPKLPGLDVPGKDKTAHVVAYALLAGLVINVAARRHPGSKRVQPPNSRGGEGETGRGGETATTRKRVQPPNNNDEGGSPLFRKPLLIALGTIILVAIAGGLDERTQPYSGRSCEFYDWLGDAAGASLVSLGYMAVAWVRSTRTTTPSPASQ